MTTPDPLHLPSGGTVTFRDSTVHFKRSHFRRLAALVETAPDGAVTFVVRSEEGFATTDVMAEALIGSWRGDGAWYLNDRPTPGEDPTVMQDVSSDDLRVLGGHLIPLALDMLGLTRVAAEGDEQGKGGAPNGSTPTTGSAASTAPTTPPETSEAPVTTLSVDSRIS